MSGTSGRLTQPGAFVLGCNYWASHAGTAMWSVWRPDIVERDLGRLQAAGLEVLRVFPLWPDFQPLTLLRGGGGRPKEFRFGEQPLPETEAGQAGLDERMLERFEEFCRLAERHRLQLIVGLITGWMSGRLFVPPALEGLNILTHPLALQWQVRFVRHFVKRLRESPAIIAWDLGNECNCMASVPGPEAAWTWTASLCHAIRASDAGRPVVSGMHSLLPEPAQSGGWTIQDQAELTDLLTTHPYPFWCRHTDRDPLDSIRPLLHATAESRMYADVGGKPCLAEEIGTMGPMLSSEAAAAAFARTNLFSLWANDCQGFLWWCAFDQTELEHAPYDWVGIERELGLFRPGGEPKPVLAELTRFRKFLDQLPFAILPARRREAVCLLSQGQDQWAAAYAAFILAKQAGIELEFQYVTQPLKDAECYLLPSLCGIESLSRRRYLQLLERVRAGATLYLSLETGTLSSFVEVTGVEVRSNAPRSGPSKVLFSGLEGAPVVTASQGRHLVLEAQRAEVLGREEDGNPVFTRAALGSGQVYLLTFPLETQLTRSPGAFHRPGAEPCWRIYQHLGRGLLKGRALVHPEARRVGVTEHPVAAQRRFAVLVNYGMEEVSEELVFNPGWRLEHCLYGTVAPGSVEGRWRLSLPAHDAAVLALG